MPDTATVGATLGPLHIRPINSAAASKGGVHGDDKTRAMGYRGGFVPDVTVDGYMNRLMAKTFRADFYAGSATCRVRQS